MKNKKNKKKCPYESHDASKHTFPFLFPFPVPNFFSLFSSLPFHATERDVKVHFEIWN